MAINNNPMLEWGKDIPPDVLAQILALKPGQDFWSSPMQTGVGEADGSLDPRMAPGHQWFLNGDQFGPSLAMDQVYGSGATEWGGNRLHSGGERAPTGAFNEYITQPRNISTWGNSDASGRWSTDGKWQGFVEDKTALRGLGDMALMAVAANYAPTAADSAGNAFGQAGSRAVTGAVTSGGSTYMMGGDTDAVLKAAIGGGVAGGITGYGADAGWNPAATRAVSTGARTLVNGGDLGDAAKNAAISYAQGSANSIGNGLLSSGADNQAASNISQGTGGNMEFNIDPSLYENIDTSGVLTNGAFDGSNVNWDFSGVNGFDPSMFTQGGGFNIGDLAKIAMGIYGASQSRNGQTTQTQTSTKEPWAPAAPYLLNQLSQGAQLQQQYAQNPFNDLQKGAISQKVGLLSGLNQQVLPGLLSGLSGVTAGYQRPGGQAPRQGFNFDPQGLLASMNNGIDWTRRG